MSDQTVSEADHRASEGQRPLRPLALRSDRGRKSALVGAGVFATLAILLYTRLFSFLPAYPAVLVAFFVWAVAPGWLLQRAVFGDRNAGSSDSRSRVCRMAPPPVLVRIGSELWMVRRET